jgi:flavodoxin I
MMKKVALIYSYNTQKTVQAAKEIIEVFGPAEIDEINAEEINGKKFLEYNNIIIGVPTWFDGELPNYWDEFVPELETLDLKGKKIAIFGNGDQRDYPENFVDAIGLIAEILEKRGAKIIGETSLEGYKYEKSRAVRNEKFLGLALEFENQSELNTIRIKNWVSSIKKLFK